MSKFTPDIPEFKWFLVHKREASGGGEDIIVYAVQARSTTEAIEIVMKQPSEYMYSTVTSVKVHNRNLTVLAYDEEKEKET